MAGDRSGYACLFHIFLTSMTATPYLLRCTRPPLELEAHADARSFTHGASSMRGRHASARPVQDLKRGTCGAAQGEGRAAAAAQELMLGETLPPLLLAFQARVSGPATLRSGYCSLPAAHLA